MAAHAYTPGGRLPYRRPTARPVRFRHASRHCRTKRVSAVKIVMLAAALMLGRLTCSTAR